jgi:diacylglycerol O-acyltransferase
MGERQRLGAQDALWLEMDKPGNLMVVDSVFWTTTPIDWSRYLEVVRERLWDRYPVFRSVAVRAEDGGWWWEEQPGATLESRLERVELAAPGGDAELQDLIASQRTAPLDRSEPLWRAMMVDGYNGGSAVLFRGHHAIADGIRMVQLALSVFDTSPGGSVDTAAVASSIPALTAVPDTAQVEARSRADRLLSLASGAAGTSLRLAKSAVTNPVGAIDSTITLSQSAVGSLVSGARTVASSGPLGRLRTPSFFAGVAGDVDTARKLVLGTRNDTTMWTGTVGQSKAVAWSPALPLLDVKAVARAHDATVNDVLVACVADSLRSYLHKHSAVCHSVNWDVPVNLKPFDVDLPVELGNSFALVQLELPTNIDDPVRTLEVVRHRMGRIKRGHEAAVDYAVQAAISRMSKRLYRATIDLLANRAVGVLTNVPGPQVPLFVAGQKVEGMMGWAPMTADQAMSVTIFSYDGKVFIGIAADTGLVPESRQIVDGFADAFRRLSLLTL